MKILYFAFVELDIPNACQTHTLGILKGFCSNKCKIDAIIPRPKNKISNIFGVKFFFIWPWRFSNLGKLWAKCLGGFYLFLLCLLSSYDAIYVRELALNPFPRWCAKLFNIPYYLELNGLPALIPKIAKNGNYLSRVEKYQRLDCRCAEGLIVPSFPRSQWLIEHYNLEQSKVHTILNGTIIPENKKLDRSISLKRLKLPVDGFFLGFLGTVWKAYDLRTVIQAMSLCKTKIPNLYLIIIGGGPDLPLLKELSNKEGIASRIVDLGFIQPDELFKVIGAIDIGLMNLTDEGINDLGPITTRFATYAAFRIPVVANRLYLENYSDKLTEGLSTVSHENPYALADLIYYLYNNPEVRAKKATAIYDFTTNELTWQLVAKKIIRIIQNEEKVTDQS